nr:4-oxalocrotonate tautomerase family protein [Marortus sp. BJYM1]
MPIIQFNLIEGRPESLKRELARRVCETVSEVLDVSPTTVRILIHEMGLNDFSVAGMTVAERLENSTPGVPYEKN